MKPCQLCGAKSWDTFDFVVPTAGPEGFMAGKDVSQYRRCDGCGSFASLVQMALEDPPRHDPVEASIKETFGGMGAYMAGPVSKALSLLPKPETRTERLVRAVLGAWGGLETEGPEAAQRLALRIVYLARKVERELEAEETRITDVAQVEVNPEEAVLGSLVWGTYEWNFRTRGELLQFLLAGIEHARRRLEGESQRAVVFNINRVTAGLIDWLEAGASRET